MSYPSPCWHLWHIWDSRPGPAPISPPISPQALHGPPGLQEVGVLLGDALQARCVWWPSTDESLGSFLGPGCGAHRGRQPSLSALVPGKDPHQDKVRVQAWGQAARLRQAWPPAKLGVGGMGSGTQGAEREGTRNNHLTSI